jgi:hypothetical protein
MLEQKVPDGSPARRWQFAAKHLLWFAVSIQALLLGWHLDLLPRWDDELFTLRAASQSAPQIIRTVQAGVHPPLYFLLVHGWLRLPLPGSALLRARALSVLLALLATILFHRLWLRPLPLGRRALFLGLWVFSPFLVLYARMARSYTLQLLLALVAIRFACQWLRAPASRTTMAGYIATTAALLYTHYLPGLAIAAGTAVAGLWRRQWRQLGPLSCIALIYLPWVATLARAVQLVARSKPYWLLANAAAENALKLSYAFVSFNFGESIAVWAMIAGAILTPLILRALWQAWRVTPHPPMLFVLAAVVGYLVASSRVSFPFVAARLIFLLPFYLLFLVRGLNLRAAGVTTYAGLFLISCAGLNSYYHKEDFLNKGYLVDFEEISRLVKEDSRGQIAFVLLDPYTSSAGYYLHGPNFPYDIEIPDDHDRLNRALAHIDQLHPTLTWCVRNSRDLTDGGTYLQLEQRLSRDCTIERHFFVPYSRLDRKIMEWLDWTKRPTHVVEALEFRPKPPLENQRRLSELGHPASGGH